MTPSKKLLLLAAWALAFSVGLLCASFFASGLLRDRRVGEPAIGIDLSAEAGQLTTSFRVFGEGDYRLFLSSVNHEPQLAGRPFGGRLKVQVTDPDGRVALDRVYDSTALDYRVPSNYGDRTLDILHLSGWPIRPWRLRVTVLDADPDFRAVRSELKLWKERYDPGMGGLINYVMIMPAGIFLGLALFISLPLASRGVRAPLISTAALIVLGLLVLS